jgi:hypothetical protein
LEPSGEGVSVMASVVLRSSPPPVMFALSPERFPVSWPSRLIEIEPGFASF